MSLLPLQRLWHPVSSRRQPLPDPLLLLLPVPVLRVPLLLAPRAATAMARSAVMLPPSAVKPASDKGRRPFRKAVAALKAKAGKVRKTSKVRHGI